VAERDLKGRRILIVEDEYLIADDLAKAIGQAGGEVIGPIPTIEDANRMIQQDGAIDAAVLDVNLRGDMVFPVADALAARNVPFLLATGYDEWMLPDRFLDARRLEKPLKGAKVVASLAELLADPV